MARKRKPPLALLNCLRNYYARVEDDGYDAADNSAKCYDLAIDTMRQKLVSFRCERIGPHKLYLGGCTQILPLLPRVDAVVMDPPYCSGGFSETGKKQAKGMGLRSETIRDVGWFAGDNMTTAGISWLMSSVAGWCYQLLPDGGTLTAFTDWRMAGHLAPAIESARFRYQNLVVWNKGNAGLGTGFRAQHELAMHFAKGTAAYHSFDYGNVLTIPRMHSSEREHQTEKPVDLMKQLLTVVSADGATILDPFMGSGSTGVACVKLGRRFIGIEIEPTYFEIACRRITEAMNQPDMFVESAKAPEPEQLTLSEAP
jgi:site-specific DNA-methyltransferase (adenine-specific)